jgi:hypothetical protein
MSVVIRKGRSLTGMGFKRNATKTLDPKAGVPYHDQPPVNDQKSTNLN